MVGVKGNGAASPPLAWRLCAYYTAGMRVLSLMRHAKSSWSERGGGGAALPDKLRSLAPRGVRDAPRMASWMAANGICPDLVLCSTAVRTRETLTFVREILPLSPTAIEFREELYHADLGALLSLIHSLDDGKAHVLLIGHDPGLHELAVALAGSGATDDLSRLHSKFPTAAVAVLDFQAERWREVRAAEGRLRLFMAPKRLP